MVKENTQSDRGFDWRGKKSNIDLCDNKVCHGDKISQNQQEYKIHFYIDKS